MRLFSKIPILPYEAAAYISEPHLPRAPCTVRKEEGCCATVYARVIASGILSIVTISAHVPVALGRMAQGFGASIFSTQRRAALGSPGSPDSQKSWEQELTGNENY